MQSIDQLTQSIRSEFGLTVKTAGEIEFYISPVFSSEDKANGLEDKFSEALFNNLTNNNIPIWKIDSEVAEGQYEVALQPNEPSVAIKELNKLKEIISHTASQFNRESNFKAKPYKDKAGSGLHIHIGVYNGQGDSALFRKDNKHESDIMFHIIGGLCSTMLKNFIHFAPHAESYERFTASKNSITENEKPFAAHNNAPVNVSWGGNNRSTAIRIPASSHDESTRHLEHRVAGSDADPEKVINSVLEGIYEGLKNKITPPQKIWGNAYDTQYSFLEKFPTSLEGAEKLNSK